MILGGLELGGNTGEGGKGGGSLNAAQPRSKRNRKGYHRKENDTFWGRS